jgi:hypothetical protein
MYLPTVPPACLPAAGLRARACVRAAACLRPACWVVARYSTNYRNHHCTTIVVIDLLLR